MTRRVGEPAQERKARQGVWGVEDIRKRPAPLVEAEAGAVKPYAYISWLEGANVAADTWWRPDVDVPEDWTEGMYNDAASGILLPDLDDGIITLTQGVSGPFGKWKCHAFANWSDAPAAGEVGIRITMTGSGAPLANITADHFQPFDVLMGDGSGGMSHCLENVVTDDAGSFTMYVWNGTAGSVFLDSIVLHVIREETFLAAEATFLP